MKRSMKWPCILALIILYALAAQVSPAQTWEAGALTDIGTSAVEFRFGRVLDETWTVGLLGTWFAEDADQPHEDWGVGAYAKLAVDPNASVPVANWFPEIGDWLDLPETMTAETYLVGKGQLLPYEESVDLALSVGAGAQVGPVVGEIVYDIIEGGDSDNPLLASGVTVWVGLCLEF